jgi:serine/threonine-protein kinase
MSDESRIQQLLEETLESGRAPEEVCAQFPQLLWRVLEGVRQCQAVEAQIDAMFPPSSDGMAARRRRLISGNDSLPEIPGYQVEAVLGRGGVGVVYRAKHLKLNRYVALKMLLSGAFADPRELARFTRESQAVASLRHEHIVQVYDVGEFDGKPYFTTEIMEGGSLAQKLAGIPQPADKAASLLMKLATAADVAHVGGIVHRDLKPSNILLTADGTPKIADFGLARRIAQDVTITEVAAHVGTPSYMAPEQALGNIGAIGPQTDIYGLGAILYELLTGRPPFRAESASETERQLISKEPVPPSRLNAKVPRDLETICLKCLRKEPERRYASAAALADDLRRFLEGRPISARPPGWGGRIWRWARREPAAAALIATTIALVALAVGGGFWAQRQKAQARVTMARQQQAVEAALVHADDLRKLGHWPEALRALDGAPSLLATSAPETLRERLRRARADADMVVRLEDIRLRLSEGAKAQGKVSPTADRLYGEAFATYGVTLATADAAVASELVRHSDIHDILVVFLHDWLYWVRNENRAKLRALVEAADDDPWRRAFRDARGRDDIAKLEQLARAPEAAAQPPALLSGLGGALLIDGHRDEAQALLRTAQRGYPADFWINYLLGQFLEQERPQEAVGYFRAAVAVRPGSDQAYLLLGRTLRSTGDEDGSIDALQKAAKLNPTREGIDVLVALLAPRGRLEEVRVLWQTMLRRDPPDNPSWFGYPQLCLFLGKEAEYRWARDAMLRRFGSTDDWIVAERTSSASLLQPLSGDELQRATALADRAVAKAQESSEPDNPYVKFVKGLSEYRLGRYELAIPFLRDSASKLSDRRGPRLVLAMAQFRAGSPAEARKTLAAAVGADDWRESRADHPGAWIYHVLRREAEVLILPDLPAFLEGRYQPRDNDERLALLGISQSRHLDSATAQLYADAFAADPGLVDRLTSECVARALRETGGYNRMQALMTVPRYMAARCAASAGCGHGADGPKLNYVQQQRWRRQSRQWLEDDLAAWTKAVTGDSKTSAELCRIMLMLWQDDPDLARLREPNALDKIPAEERVEWIALWKQVRDSLASAERANR